MWISPNHPNPPQSRPPEEQGRTLCTCDRNQGRERIRVSLETYNGSRPFLRFQGWQLNGEGEWWPAKGRCVTLPVDFAGELIAALRQAEDLVDGGRGLDSGPVRGHDAGQGTQYRGDDGRSPAPRDDDERPRYVERRKRPQARPVDPADFGGETTCGDRVFDEFA